MSVRSERRYSFTFASQQGLSRELDFSSRYDLTSVVVSTTTQLLFPGRQNSARATTLDHRRGFSRLWMILSQSTLQEPSFAFGRATLSPRQIDATLEAATDELCIECTRGACLSSFSFPASPAFLSSSSSCFVVFFSCSLWPSSLPSSKCTLRNCNETTMREKESFQNSRPTRKKVIRTATARQLQTASFCMGTEWKEKLVRFGYHRWILCTSYLMLDTCEEIRTYCVVLYYSSKWWNSSKKPHRSQPNSCLEKWLQNLSFHLYTLWFRLRIYTLWIR